MAIDPEHGTIYVSPQEEAIIRELPYLPPQLLQGLIKLFPIGTNRYMRLEDQAAMAGQQEVLQMIALIGALQSQKPQAEGPREPIADPGNPFYQVDPIQEMRDHYPELYRK